MKSVYIHIPFCDSICSYCDFAKVYYNEKIVDKYLESLEKEVTNNYKGEAIKTLYIGGGTPSSLNMLQLKKLLNLTNIFDETKIIEKTFECNIENITEEKIKLLKEYNFNRISIGIQTFNDKYLKFLNRFHTNEMIKDKIIMIKKYFTNINVDLMYGFKGQTLKDLENDLEEFIKLDISHISTYSLIIEPHTVLYNKGIDNIDEDLDFKMYQTIISKLYKYNHYETSNFSKPGYESKHNLTYWDNEEYYGFGCGASGFINNHRYDNTRSITSYIKGEYNINNEEMTKALNMENEFILGLRKIKGIDINLFYKKYNKNVLDIKQIKKLLEEGKLTLTNNFIRISDKYTYLANEVLVELINENYEK